MTNYNERLDGILDRVYLFGMNGGLGYEKFEDELSPKDAKQALTSLIKELAAEAKPGKYSSGESILNVDGIGEVDGYEGYNQAIDHFEQNLLKALEEK